jgi:hypothetical protein
MLEITNPAVTRDEGWHAFRRARDTWLRALPRHLAAAGGQELPRDRAVGVSGRGDPAALGPCLSHRGAARA